VTYLLGRLPQPDDTVRYGNLRFTVERVHKRRIGSVLLEVVTPEDAAHGEERAA
jgi:CBS domain containing-hemolysin-like protein